MAHPPPEADVPASRVAQRAGLIGGPVLALLILALADLGSPATTRTAAVAVLMAVWWITEALPLAVTALLPLVLMPVLGIQSGEDVAQEYMNWIIFLFIGGFLIALAMERWNLHRRIALAILSRTGSRPAGVLFGFMAATFFISMWISNTATAMMMIPIGVAILVQLEDFRRGPERSNRAFGVALMLGIAYAASIGGMATLVGTPPNMALVGIYDKTFPNERSVDFARWMLVALPMALVLFLAAWGWLAWPLRQKEGAPARLDRRVIREEASKLGPWTRPEKLVLAVFTVTAVAWLTRASVEFPFGTFSGWSSWFPDAGLLDDGTVGITFAFLLFLLPSGQGDGERLLDAKVFPKLPWGIVLLFGGGFALASAFEESGLSLWIGEQLVAFGALPLPILIGLVCLIITFLSEVTSNTATAQILLPVLAGLAVKLDMDPLMLMIPGALAASLGFMLPVATPPNAIAFATERLRVSDMMKAGLWLNLVGIVVVTLAMLLWGRTVFGLGE